MGVPQAMGIRLHDACFRISDDRCDHQVSNYFSLPMLVKAGSYTGHVYGAVLELVY